MRHKATRYVRSPRPRRELRPPRRSVPPKRRNIESQKKGANEAGMQGDVVRCVTWNMEKRERENVPKL